MMEKKINILILEDLLSDLELILLELEKAKINFNHLHVESKEGFKKGLTEFKPDLVLSDYRLPQFTGKEALTIAKEISSDVPFIIVTGTINEETAVACMKAGAIDYILKENLGRLGSAVKSALERKAEIDARKKAEEALKTSEAQLSNAMMIAKLGYWEYDVDDDLFTFNDHFYNIFHTTTEKVGGYKMSPAQYAERFLHPDDKPVVAAEMKKAFETPDPDFNRTFEHRIIYPDGTTGHISVRFFIVKDSQGRTIKTFGANQDITERKQVEKELIKAKEKAEESDRLKSAFLANMSHEIRTPMNGILGFAQLLKEPDLTSEEKKQYIKQVEKSSDRMLNIITNIVIISKIESGQMEVSLSKTNLNQQIEKIYTTISPDAERKGLQFSVRATLSSSESIIQTDCEKIFTILTNLVDNALKFTDHGSIELGYEQKDKHLVFFVKDTGDGIPDDKLELIFDRFRQGSESMTRNYEGAGLGLSIAKAYVEMLGGRIWLESELGKGSVFYFSIPYHVESEKESLSKDDSSGLNNEQQRKDLKLLIVEDDESSELFLSEALELYCREILTATTGIEAVNICRNNPDLDLVLMDIRMPGMDGYEATRQIRQFNKEVVIIAQTAFGLSGDREKAIAAGCNDYISKPVNMALLKAMINKHCRENSSHD